MADFQTITAALSVVHIAGITIGLFKGVVEAQGEIQTWLRKVESVEAVCRNIAIAVKTRGDMGMPPISLDIRDRILKALDDCRQCFKTMETKLRRNQGSISGSMRHPFSRTDLENQERTINDLHTEISLSLNLLIFADQHRTQQLLQVAVNLLTAGHVSDRPLSEVNDDPPSSGADVSSGSTDPPTDDGNPSPQELMESYLTTSSREPEAMLAPAEDLLLSAVKKDRLEEVRDLLKRSDLGQSLYAVDLDDWTVLHHAARRNDPVMMKLLLDTELRENQGFVDKKSRQGHTALMGVAKHAGTAQAVDLARLLLDGGCKINIYDNSEQTALGFAIEDAPNEESEKLVGLLLRRGADVTLLESDMDRRKRERWPEIDAEIRKGESRD